jgi:hypothetical protein
MKRHWNSIVLLWFLPIVVVAQTQDSVVVEQAKKKNLRIAALAASGVYAGGLIGLNALWYKNADRQSFRFFNDNAEWKQVDKAGHLFSAFHLSYGISRGLQYFDVTEDKADVIGAVAGFAVLVPIEIFDGYSDAYGASWGDLVADGVGSLLYLGQKRLWSEVRILPKYSFHASRFSHIRPDVLGNGMERLLKDYNGQTYWLSVDMDKFVPFPKWLNVAIGYGAEGMIYARDQQQRDAGFRPAYRQYYLSLDLDLQSIPTRSRALKTVLFLVGMIKVPLPTLEYRHGDFVFHALYF